MHGVALNGEQDPRPGLARLHALLPVLSQQAMEAQRTCEEAARMLAAAGLNENVLGRGADIRALIRIRALRNQYMPADWFSDPAWDLLLYLYEAHVDDQELTVGDLIDRTGLKATTASRWLDSLAVRHFVIRHRCESDHRRVLIELTPKGVAALDSYFDALRVDPA